ncbi:hypothetical protein B0T24DRAFT_694788 [Lasiosphaeria ovina]|uniref:Heterokaryon incompatibility domain-containing protein n=1 Tax=Lasiosphaeria ovina TaxID=92902 RepID=A0AAE0KNP5_9PEZI|nr:hypothetical protein B0T24DRAFT_694788 [Lasiosphaeria ovina]
MPEEIAAMETSTGRPTPNELDKLCSMSVTVPGQFRLLRVRLLGEGQLVASLKTYGLLKDRPEYEALSYVWGNKGQGEMFKLQVDCEGHSHDFDLLPSLHTALLHIMSHVPGQERILWTDRICIRQIDEDEKNPQVVQDNKADNTVQVAQMAEIYKKAQRVLVWLGKPARHLGEMDVAHNLGTSRRLLDVADTVSDLAKNAGPRFDPRGTAGLPPASDPVWAVFSDIVRKDWYKRIWTLQEAVLAQELTVHYGAHVLAWDDVERLVNVYGQVPVLRDQDDRRDRDNFRDPDDLQQRWRWRFHHVMWIHEYQHYLRQTPPKTIALAHLLNTSMYKASTRAHDRVYGLLGLAHQSVRDGIVIDYDRPLRDVYVDACRQILQRDTKLQLLSLPFERDGRGGLPSWCPDLARWNGCEVQRQPVRQRRKPSTCPGSVRISDDDRLHVRGFVADTITAVSHAAFPGFAIREPERRWRHIAAYYRESLAVAKGAAGGTDTGTDSAVAVHAESVHWRTLIADRHGFEGALMTTAEAERGYRSYFARGEAAKAQRSAEETRLADTYSAYVLEACNRRKFARTKGGRVGLAPETCQVGDVVCVFQGAVVPHVLRRNIDDDGGASRTFTFLGDCYVYGLMESAAVDAFDEGLEQGREFVLT